MIPIHINKTNFLSNVQQHVRDQRDSARADSPLRPAAGSVTLDTTGLTLEQVVARVVAMVPGR